MTSLFNAMFTLSFIPLSKNQTRCPGHSTLTRSMKKSLSPPTHDPKLLILSHTLHSVSHFSHSPDKFIYMKDHSRWHGPAGKWQPNQWFRAMLPFLSCARKSTNVVSVSLLNLPYSHDWRDQHVLIILPRFQLDHRGVQLHKHSTSNRDKHRLRALHTESAGTGTR